MHVAYKHLDSKLKIADLTFGQWGGIVVGLIVAMLWGFELSPFGEFITLASAIYLGAIPAGAALMASWADVNPWLILRSAVRWSRVEGRHVPGPGMSAHGYLVTEDADAAEEGARSGEQRPLLETLWDS